MRSATRAPGLPPPRTRSPLFQLIEKLARLPRSSAALGTGAALSFVALVVLAGPGWHTGPTFFHIYGQASVLPYDHIEKSPMGSDPTLYSFAGDLDAVQLGSDGTANGKEDVIQKISTAWTQSQPLGLKGYIPKDMLGWWTVEAGGRSPPASVRGKLMSALGAQTVEVLRYAHRGREAQSGKQREDYRTRLMPVDSTHMQLGEFLRRDHQQPGRKWPVSPMAGEQFMFKRKVPKGYRALPQSHEGVGAIEAYVRKHLPHPVDLWQAPGAAGACGVSGTSNFRYDDPMLRLQTPFFTFPGITCSTCPPTNCV